MDDTTTTDVGDGTGWTLTSALREINYRQMIMLAVQDDRGRTIEIKGD